MQGIQTGFVAKWHLGDNAPCRPQDRGFQEVLWHKGGGIGQAPDYWQNDQFDDVYERNGKYEKFTGYATDVWFRESMAFVERNQGQPLLSSILPPMLHTRLTKFPKNGRLLIGKR